MNEKSGPKFFLELRFWDATLSSGILECMARDYSLRLLKRRQSETEAWYRVELSGDVRKVDSLRNLGRRLGFYVGTPTAAVA